MAKALEKLQQWVAAGGAVAEIGLALGYRGGDAVRQWLRRGEIPHYRESSVLDWLAGKTARVKKKKKGRANGKA